jgi:pimeloyl-ACP methyl ester carboxylesterase
VVNKLVILSVPHPAGLARELATNKAQQEGSNYARNFQKEGSEKNLTAEGLAGWVKDPKEKPGYIEAFKRSDFGAMMNYYRANYPKGVGETAGPPPSFPPIKVPVLVIHGMKDTALNAAGHNGTWDHVTADTTILMIPTAGHFVQHDAEAIVGQTVKDWLNARR